jgi:hypothetical protein
MLRLSLAASLLVACGGGAGPPRGPEYKPVGSPEAESPCPEEWKAAKEGRERLLDDSSRTTRLDVAEKVLLQADCERGVLALAEIAPGSQEAVLAEVRLVRERDSSIGNLYGEVLSYDFPLLNVGARAGRGQLHALFALKLRAMPTPVDLNTPADRTSFRQELVALVRGFDNEAAVDFVAALDGLNAFRPAPEDEARVEAWTRAGCSGLEALDRDRSNWPSCR